MGWQSGSLLYSSATTGQQLSLRTANEQHQWHSVFTVAPMSHGLFIMPEICMWKRSQSEYLRKKSFFARFLAHNTARERRKKITQIYVISQHVGWHRGRIWGERMWVRINVWMPEDGHESGYDTDREVQASVRQKAQRQTRWKTTHG